MRKRILSVLLIISMIAAVSACDHRGMDLAMDTGWDVDFTEEPTTITYLTIGDKPTNGKTENVIKELNKILVKKVNAKLDIYYVGWDDYLNQYNSALRTAENIDLIGTSTDWLDAWPNVVDGNFLPMSKEMIRTFCPRTYFNVMEEQWNKCTYNGNIYFIPENEYTQWTNHGFIYRLDIARQAGIDCINNWNDLNDYMVYLTSNRQDMLAWDADGTNVIPTLGYLTSVSEYVPIYEISTYGLWGIYGKQSKTIESPYYSGEDYINYARLMKKWDEMGVWRAGLDGSGDNSDEFYSGYTALDEHHTQKYYTEIEPTMEVRQPGAEIDFYWFGKDCGNLQRTSILHGAMAISARSKNPEKALMVYDELRNDPECYRLICYGIEGVQYVRTKDGRIEKPSGYNENRDSIVTNFWWGRRDELELSDKDYAWDEYYELIDDYDHVAIDYLWDGYNLQFEMGNEELSAVLAICDEYIPRIAYGQYSCTPEEEVEEFRARLKEAGFENITNQIQKIVDSY